MSVNRPNFRVGLFGMARHEACNSWTDAAAALAEKAEGLDAAQQGVVGFEVPTTHLAKMTSASTIGGTTNRWKYSGVAFVVDGTTPEALTDDYGLVTDAINIREFRNDGSTIDGSPIPSGASVGPVGSSWSGSAWSTSELAGYVWIHREYQKDGTVLYWFDTPNPSRCS